MRYYSDVCHKLFDSQEELDKAEAALTAKKDKEAKEAAERKADSDEILKAFDKIISDIDEYNKLVDKFVAKHGSYHKTITKPLHLSDVVNSIWNIFDMI